MLLQEFVFVAVFGNVVLADWIFVTLSRRLPARFGFSWKEESSAKDSVLSQLQTPRTSMSFDRCKPLKRMRDYE